MCRLRISLFATHEQREEVAQSIWPTQSWSNRQLSSVSVTIILPLLAVNGPRNWWRIFSNRSDTCRRWTTNNNTSAFLRGRTTPTCRAVWYFLYSLHCLLTYSRFELWYIFQKPKKFELLDYFRIIQIYSKYYLLPEIFASPTFGM